MNTCHFCLFSLSVFILHTWCHFVTRFLKGFWKVSDHAPFSKIWKTYVWSAISCIEPWQVTVALLHWITGRDLTNLARWEMREQLKSPGNRSGENLMHSILKQDPYAWIKKRKVHGVYMNWEKERPDRARIFYRGTGRSSYFPTRTYLSFSSATVVHEQVRQYRSVALK